jgi:F-type H+-transporting ATPase subunit delta
VVLRELLSIFCLRAFFIFEQNLAMVGKNLELKKKIDESLIGGVTIKVDDTLIDASVKSQLDKLKNTLSNN